MLTKSEIELICYELETDLPIYLPSCIKQWIKGNEYKIHLLQYREVFDRVDFFTFLLLVLAAEGVPYDC